MENPMEHINELLSSVRPEIAHQLKEEFEAVFNMSFSNGFSAGVRDADERNIKNAEKYKNIGEARGIAWAYHAVHNNKVRDVLSENPFANRHLVNGLIKK